MRGILSCVVKISHSMIGCVLGLDVFQGIESVPTQTSSQLIVLQDKQQ